MLQTVQDEKQAAAKRYEGPVGGMHAALWAGCALPPFLTEPAASPHPFEDPSAEWIARYPHLFYLLLAGLLAVVVYQLLFSRNWPSERSPKASDISKPVLKKRGLTLRKKLDTIVKKFIK